MVGVFLNGGTVCCWYSGKITPSCSVGFQSLGPALVRVFAGPKKWNGTGRLESETRQSAAGLQNSVLYMVV